MNGLLADIEHINVIATLPRAPGVDCTLCLPATLIAAAAAGRPDVIIGAQDCHQFASGPHTGCVSAAMLKEAGAHYVIVGHSERRRDQHECDEDVRMKAQQAHRARMRAIVCVGESAVDRSTGRAIDTVTAQLLASLPAEGHSDWLTIAYEPNWAIGTGVTPSRDDIAQMHAIIRNLLIEKLGETGAGVRILYGGSMNGDNAAELLAIPNVNGGLVGGASLTAPLFAPIVEAANAIMVCA